MKSHIIDIHEHENPLTAVVSMMKNDANQRDVIIFFDQKAYKFN